MSSRPSDAIALAVRIGSPIFAEEDVLDEAGRVEQPDEEEAEEMVEEFRDVHRPREPRRLRPVERRAWSWRPWPAVDLAPPAP